jgi:hypothetical protein
VKYEMPLKTARMQVMCDLLANGTLEIGTAGMGKVLVTYEVSSSGGHVEDDVWTVAFDDDDAEAVAMGECASARFRTSAGVTVISDLSVGQDDADIIINNVRVMKGQTVELQSAAIQHA